MNGPTDDQIFNHMAPDDEPYCGMCGSYEVESVEYDDYKTYKCLDCHFEPSPTEEQKNELTINKKYMSDSNTAST